MSFIASGTYGCVFKPHLPCEKNKKVQKPKAARTISKVFRDKKEADTEKQLNDILNKIDPNNEFTIPLYDACILSKQDVKNKDELLSCKHIRPKITNQQLIFKYGGISLSEYLKKTEFTTTKFKQLLTSLLPIFKGVQKLHDAGYVHLDIKPDNILYMPSAKKTYLIDFGLMTEKNKVFHKKEMEHILQHPYPFYPPEFKIIYDKSVNNIKSIMKKSLSPKISTYTTDTDYQNQLQSCSVELDLGIENLLKSNLRNILLTNRIDSYSLGMSLCTILAWIPEKNNFTTRTWSIIVTFKNCIRLLCNPIERINIKDAVIMYENFIKEF